MKRNYLFIAVAGMVLILTASVLSPAKPTGNESVKPVTTSSIPDDLQLIFKTSCMACHATGGSNMAMSMLNFSEWENYEPGKQAKKAGAICYMLTKGKMPPNSFRKSNPDLIPTEAQKDTICKWSETLNQNK
jgi:cytochrome c5